MNFFFRLRMFLRFIVVKFRYNPKYYVRILGKAFFENKNIVFGKNDRIFNGVKFWGSGKIILGDNVVIGDGTIIYSNEEVKIGDNTMIAAQCYIIDCDHGTELGNLMRNQKLVTKAINIGNDVWIAAGVKVLKGANIKDGVVIGASSVVTGKLETKENTIYAGIPARKVSKRK